MTVKNAIANYIKFHLIIPTKLVNFNKVFEPKAHISRLFLLYAAKHIKASTNKKLPLILQPLVWSVHLTMQ